LKNVSAAPIVEYSIEQYTSDAYPAGVRKAVYVETVWPGDPVGETLWLEDIARTSKYGFPQGQKFKNTASQVPVFN
jgi:predicted TIM-barrel fold metal-dependent hydrolase